MVEDVLLSSSAWDRVNNTTGFSTGSGAPTTTPPTVPTTLPTTGVASAGAASLTYYVRFTLANGTELTLNNDQLFQLSSFAFDDEQDAEHRQRDERRGGGQGHLRPADPVVHAAGPRPAAAADAGVGHGLQGG